MPNEKAWNRQEMILLFLFCCLFFLLLLLHLFACFKEQERLRKCTKPGLMFLAFLLSVLLFPQEYFLWIGCLFGLFGDIFFLFKDKKICLYFGLVTFLLNHVFYILECSSLLFRQEMWNKTDSYLFIFLPIGFLLLAYPLIRKILKIEIPMAMVGSLYSASLFLDFVMNIVMVAKGYKSMILGIIGMVLFIFSDAFLSYTLFIRDVKRRDFYIMLTYSLAQALVLSGIYLILF